MAWYDKLPRTLQAWLTIVSLGLGLIGSAFAVGAATGGTVGEMRTMPSRMAGVEARVDTLWSTSEYLMQVDSQRIGVWTNVATMAAHVAETRCFVRAMALKEDPLVKCNSLLTPDHP